ncbi:BA14K family protein [Brevundimonas sp.]|jgi:hypothetical protein|uniref:BA14K family protein n=1 Tax=Brevundimonas sp. TaxID=1871086 RepID=UPI0037C0C14C
MRPVLIAVALATLTSSPVLAQARNYGWRSDARAYDHPASYGYGGRYDFNGQADRPGDYRCDRYWDANRADCGAAWRDQRPYRDRGYYTSGGRYAHGHSYGRYGYSQGAAVYPGAYGRPDLIYPGGGYGYGPRYGQAYGPGRDGRRIDWCRATYRSYDPASGYYRAYSGQLIFCG